MWELDPDISASVERMRLGGHAGVSLSVAFSPYGQFLASGGEDGTTRIWDFHSGNEIAVLEHETQVTDVAFSESGNLIACACGDATASLWSCETWNRLASLDFGFIGHRVGSAGCVAFSGDSRYIAVGYRGAIDENLNPSSFYDTDVAVWDVSSGDFLFSVPHEYSVNAVAFSPRGNVVASSSWDGQLKIWSLPTGALVSELEVPGWSGDLAYSHDGAHLLWAGHGGIRIWETTTWSVVGAVSRSLNAYSHTPLMISAGLSPNETLWVTGDNHETIGFWDVTTILNPNESPTASFTSQALSETDNRLALEPRSGDMISFDASASSDSDGEIVEYAWDWDSDGFYELATADPVAECSFASAGSHRVTLRVTDDAGAMDTATKTLTIEEAHPPSAVFRFAPSSPSILDTVEFTDTSSDTDGKIAAWRWDFGDGTTSAERHPVHEYIVKGAYTVRLTVTDHDGLTAYVDRDLEIVNLPPEGTYAWGVVEEEGMRLMVEPRVGKPLRFDASASADSDGDIVEYAWDWDSDGTYDETTTEPVTDHWFDDEGVHDVTLRVTDDDGGAGTYAESVTIAATPQIVEPDGVLALVVGVSDYTDVNDLTYARSDAEAFARWLIDAGVSADSITLLLDEAGELEDLGLQYDTATLSRFRAGLGWLRKQAKPDDLVFVYFAGHGYQGEDDDGDEADGVDEFLVLHDTMRSAVEETALRDDEFGAFLDRVGSDHVMVVFDSCHSGGQSRSLSSGSRPLGDTFDLFNDFSLDGKLILAAAREDQEALEHEGLGHGLFTHFLLQGLEGDADLDSDYRITAEELHAYVSTEVERYAWEVRGREQTPEMTGRGEVGIVVSRTNRPPEASFDVQPEIPYAHGEIRFEDTSTDDTEIVSWQWDLGDGTSSEEQHPTHVYEEPGSYPVMLTVEDGGGATSSIEHEVVVAPPGEVTLVSGETVIISLGESHGIQVGDRFEVVRKLELSSGTAFIERKGTIEVVEVVDEDRSACTILDSLYPMERADEVRVADE